jgi:hypothetical protein
MDLGHRTIHHPPFWGAKTAQVEMWPCFCGDPVSHGVMKGKKEIVTETTRDASQYDAAIAVTDVVESELSHPNRGGGTCYAMFFC